MNCKPGDLAIIVRAILPENIGRIVEIVRLIGEALDGLGPIWLVRGSQPLARSANKGSVRLDDSLERSFIDAWLRPISGVPVNDEVTDDIREPA
jgi:hypothetical protein